MFFLFLSIFSLFIFFLFLFSQVTFRDRKGPEYVRMFTVFMVAQWRLMDEKFFASWYRTFILLQIKMWQLVISWTFQRGTQVWLKPLIWNCNVCLLFISLMQTSSSICVVWQRRGVLFHCRLDLSHHMVGIYSITPITVNHMSLMLMTSQMMSLPPKTL